MKNMDIQSNILFDFNRTLFDPSSGTLMPGASGVLQALKEKGYTLLLVSKKEGGREHILGTLDIEHFFESVHFVEKKTAEVFGSILKKRNIIPKDVSVVGDYLYDEIRAGNSIGATTIWLKRGAFAHLTPKTKKDIPDHTITSIKDLLPHVA